MLRKTKLTQEGLQKLQEEYRYLLDVVRPEITKDLVEARSLGDLSENAEYDDARERQGKTESRILEIESILSNHEIIKESNSRKRVSIGNFVTIKYLNNDVEDKYQIVGTVEANPLEKRISFESPLAKAILDAKVGEEKEVLVAKPYRVKILKISKK